MKLNKMKVRCIFRQYRKHVSTKEFARDIKVSPRRVQQIIKRYEETVRGPILGEIVGRPAKPHDEKEAEIIRAAHARYRFGVKRVIRRHYTICISHNRIHMYLKDQGLAQEDEKKQKRRKGVRYERKHSLSAGHID